MKKLCMALLTVVSAVLLCFGIAACDLWADYEPLAVPQNVKIEGDVLSWSAVDRASAGYTVKINDDETTKATGTSLDLTTVTQLLHEGANTLSVKANATFKAPESAYSAGITYTYTPAEENPEEKPGEEKPGEEKPSEEKPGEEKPGEEKPGEEKPGEEKPGEEKPGEHTHELTLHPAKDATCTEAGNTAYWSCEGCEKFFSDDKGEHEAAKDSWVLSPKGHDYGEPEWTWAEDFSTATAKFTCKNDETHVESVEATVTQTAQKTQCTEETVYNATATFNGKEYKEKQTKITQGQHTLGAWQVEVPATCIAQGTKGHYFCEVCEKYFDEDGATEITELTIPIDENAHDLREHAKQEPTCAEEGNEKYYLCELCHKYFKDEEGHDEFAENEWKIPATGHSYNSLTWAWTPSGEGFAAKATFKCGKCGDEQTVDASVVKTETPATCTDDGDTTYTATATFKEETYTSAKSILIPAKGHNYGEPKWTWEETDDGFTATATFTCQNDAQHTRTETATVDSGNVTNPATCTADGTMTYTATVNFGGKEYTATNTKDIPATGQHTYTEGNWETDGTHHWQKCTVCGQNGEKTDHSTTDKVWKHDDTNHYKVCDTCKAEFDKAAHDSNVTLDKVEATCTQKGKTEGKKCSVCGEITVEQHETDMLKHNLQKTEAKAATCTEDGNDAYWTCETCEQYFQDENGNETYEPDGWVKHALGHSMETKVDYLAPTCEADGNKAYYYCNRCKKYFQDPNGETEYPDGKPVLAKLDHASATRTEAKAAGVGVEGNDAYWYCSDCKTYFEDNDGVRGDKLETNAAPTIPAIVIKTIDKYETYIANNDHGIEEAYPTGQSVYYIFRTFRDENGKAWTIPEDMLIVTLKVDNTDVSTTVSTTIREDNQYVFAVSIDKPTDAGRTISYQFYGEDTETTVKLAFKSANFWFEGNGKQTYRAYEADGTVNGHESTDANGNPALFDIYAKDDVKVENFGDKAVELKGMPLLSGVKKDDVATKAELAAYLYMEKVFEKNGEELNIVIVGYHRWKDAENQTIVYTLVNSAGVSDVFEINAEDRKLKCDPKSGETPWSLSESKDGNITYNSDVLSANKNAQEGVYIYIYNANGIEDVQDYDFSNETPYASYEITSTAAISQKTLDRLLDEVWLEYAKSQKDGKLVTKYNFVFAMRAEPIERAKANGCLPSDLVYAEKGGERDVREYDLAFQIDNGSVVDDGIWGNGSHNFTLITDAQIDGWLEKFKEQLTTLGLSNVYTITKENVADYFEIEISTKEKAEEGYTALGYSFSIRAPFKVQGYSFDAFVAAMAKDYFTEYPDADKEGEGIPFKFELYLSIVLKEKIGEDSNKLLPYFRASEKKLAQKTNGGLDFQSHTFTKDEVTATNEAQVNFTSNGYFEFLRKDNNTRNGWVFTEMNAAYVELKFTDGNNIYTAYIFADAGENGIIDGTDELYLYSSKEKGGESQGIASVSNGYITTSDFNMWAKGAYSLDESFDVSKGWSLQTRVIVDESSNWLFDGDWSAEVKYQA